MIAERSRAGLRAHFRVAAGRRAVCWWWGEQSISEGIRLDCNCLKRRCVRFWGRWHSWGVDSSLPALVHTYHWCVMWGYLREYLIHLFLIKSNFRSKVSIFPNYYFLHSKYWMPTMCRMGKCHLSYCPSQWSLSSCRGATAIVSRYRAWTSPRCSGGNVWVGNRGAAFTGSEDASWCCEA